MSAWEGSYFQQQSEQAKEQAERVAQMTPAQKAAHFRVPLIPGRKVDPALDSNPITGICGACGTEIRKIMHLACAKSECPLSERIR
jgi:hypothetical protein